MSETGRKTKVFFFIHLYRCKFVFENAKKKKAKHEILNKKNGVKLLCATTNTHSKDDSTIYDDIVILLLLPWHKNAQTL